MMQILGNSQITFLPYYELGFVDWKAVAEGCACVIGAQVCDEICTSQDLNGDTTEITQKTLGFYIQLAYGAKFGPKKGSKLLL